MSILYNTPMMIIKIINTDHVQLRHFNIVTDGLNFIINILFINYIIILLINTGDSSNTW